MKSRIIRKTSVLVLFLAPELGANNQLDIRTYRLLLLPLQAQYQHRFLTEIELTLYRTHVKLQSAVTLEKSHLYHKTELQPNFPLHNPLPFHRITTKFSSLDLL